MNCKSAQVRLSAYLDRELTGNELLELRDHLRGCEQCRLEEMQLRELKTMLGCLSVAEPPADLADRLCATIIKQPSPTEAKWSWKRSVITFSAVAACSMVTTFLVISLRSDKPTQLPARDSVAYDVIQDQAYTISSDPTEGSPLIPVSSYGQR